MAYNELIQRLRYAASYDPCIVVQDCKDAADAIEKLKILADNGEATYEIMVRQTSYIEKLKQKIPHWIPVTERLPCLTTPVLATDGIEVDIAWMYGVPPRWITSFTAIDEDKLTHWMPLPQTPKDGE